MAVVPNLRRIREERGWTQEQAAAALATTRNQYVKLENGSRRLNADWIQRAAAAYGIDPGEIVRGADPAPIASGAVGSKGLVHWASGAPLGGGGLVHLTVCDGALGPLLDGWFLVIEARAVCPDEVLEGGEYVACRPGLGADGLFCRVQRSAAARGTFHLIRHAAAPIFDTRIDRAYRARRLIKP